MKVFDVTEANFKFRRIAFLALVLMCLDVCVMGMPALGLMICFLLVVTSGILCLWFLLKDKTFSIGYISRQPEGNRIVNIRYVNHSRYISYLRLIIKGELRYVAMGSRLDRGHSGCRSSYSSTIMKT